MKQVRVIKRDRRNRPCKAALSDTSSPIEIIVERWAGIEWQPIHAIKGATVIDLPRGFELHRDSLRVLDEAR